MLEATKDSIRLLSEATSDAIVDSLSATRSLLEDLYESGAGGFSEEEIQQDLTMLRQITERIRQLTEHIKTEGEIEKRIESLSSDGQTFLKQLVGILERYSDFIPTAVIEQHKAQGKRVEGLVRVFNSLDLILSALENVDADLPEKLYAGLANLSEDIEKYASYFSKTGKLMKLFKLLAERIHTSTVDVLSETYTQPSEIRGYLIAVKNTARSILWQIDDHEKEKKSTVGDLLNWLETSPGWAGDDFEECLDYVNRTRK